MRRSSAVLRLAGAVDVVSGVTALAAAGWLGDQLGLGTSTVRVVAAVTLLLGIDTWLLASRPVMAKATMVIEALVALVAVDLAVLGDPTGTGTALLLATAAWCAALAARIAMLERTPALAAA